MSWLYSSQKFAPPTTNSTLARIKSSRSLLQAAIPARIVARCLQLSELVSANLAKLFESGSSSFCCFCFCFCCFRSTAAAWRFLILDCVESVPKMKCSIPKKSSFSNEIVREEVLDRFDARFGRSISDAGLDSESF